MSIMHQLKKNKKEPKKQTHKKHRFSELLAETLFQLFQVGA